MKRSPGPRVRGFTLIDVVIVLALVLLFVYLGCVTYTNIIANRQRSKVSDVSDMLDASLKSAQVHPPGTVPWHQNIPAERTIGETPTS